MRLVLGIAAIPLAPVLYKGHFVILVLLRPTKEVLLAGGFLMRKGEVALVPVLLAAVPLAIFGVWLLYALGRAYAIEIRDGAGLPRWAERVLPPRRIKALCAILDQKGWPVIVIGRLAAFPSALLGAAAGASDLSSRVFLPADGIGGLLSIAEVLIAGYVFGSAYKEAGPWVTGLGVAALAGMLVLVGRWLRREEKAKAH
ncbi:MAG TPA: VTT domain-containing protein, partial [Acidimicrobiales bacterium]|nr:VTT domain-containing protein [Acidimicrobiales bacterium]